MLNLNGVADTLAFVIVTPTFLFLALQPQQKEVRTYWPVTVETQAKGLNKHTHVQTTGKVKYTMHEGDGDIHFKLQGLNDPTKFIICECIPLLPCKVPIVGSIVTVKGITRFDGEHKWYEIHPVESVK